MKKLLLTEAVLAGLLLIFIMSVIQISVWKKEELLDTETERSQIRPSRDLWIYGEGISSGVSPLEKKSGLGQNIWGLCFSNLYEDAMELKEEVFLENSRKEEISFWYIRREKEEQTEITIKIHPSLKTNTGQAITADDLLFNFYLRCDPFTEEGEEGSMGIRGGREFYYGTKQVKQRRKEIKACLKKPGKSLQETIRKKIILPELLKEYQWAESLFAEKEYQSLTKNYDSVGEFFAHYYAYKTSYRPGKKSKEEVLSEIAGQYGANYPALEKITGRSYGKQAEIYALEEILKKKGKDQVDTISGLEKLDEHTIRLVLAGKQESIRQVMDVWILPWEIYGKEKGNFVTEQGVTFQKGDAASVVALSRKKYQGSGAFYCQSMNEDTLCFCRNRYYFKGSKSIEKLYLSCNRSDTSGEIVEKMLAKKIDLAVYPLAKEHDLIGARGKLALIKPDEEKEYGILYRTGYINATTFPVHPRSLREIFSGLGSLEINI